jgi:hypothetical protein
LVKIILTDTTAQEREEKRGVSRNLRRDLELCKLLAVLGNTAPVVVPTEQSNGKTEDDHVHSDDDRLPIEKSLAMVMRIDADDNGRSVVSTSRALRAASVGPEQGVLTYRVKLKMCTTPPRRVMAATTKLTIRLMMTRKR